MSNRGKKTNQNGPRKGPVEFQVSKRPAIRAAVIVPYTANRQTSKEPAEPSYHLEQRLNEAAGLAAAIDLDIKAIHDVSVDKPRPATYFGKGKVEELDALFALQDVEIVVVDHDLTPGQQRNLERAWQAKVVDRTNLILEIFGRRAATREGRLQVELAHLNYQKSRLVRSWTHLERQRGGKGFLGGPGETQIESDRRQIQSRILRLTKDLEKVRKTREQHRKKRRQIPYPVVALVGYTNAGKSTLFNKLTGADVVAKDQLFATLDPTMRALNLPSGTTVILSDTVGFVSNLPTQLIAAFRATLEEVIEADLILHVQDASSESRRQQRNDVLKVLAELGIKDTDPGVPVFEVLNKIDNLSESERVAKSAADIKHETDNRAFQISALTGEGTTELLTAIEAALTASQLRMQITLGSEQSDVIGWLYKNRCVLGESVTEDGDVEYDISIPKNLAGKLENKLSAVAKAAT